MRSCARRRTTTTSRTPDIGGYRLVHTSTLWLAALLADPRHVGLRDLVEGRHVQLHAPGEAALLRARERGAGARDALGEALGLARAQARCGASRRRVHRTAGDREGRVQRGESPMDSPKQPAPRLSCRNSGVEEPATRAEALGNHPHLTASPRWRCPPPGHQLCREGTSSSPTGCRPRNRPFHNTRHHTLTFSVILVTSCCALATASSCWICCLTSSLRICMSGVRVSRPPAATMRSGGGARTVHECNRLRWSSIAHPRHATRPIEAEPSSAELRELPMRCPVDSAAGLRPSPRLRQLPPASPMHPARPSRMDTHSAPTGRPWKGWNRGGRT